MPKVNTLFSYFTKSPASNKPKAQNSEANSPKSQQISPKTLKGESQNPKEFPFKPNDLVWAKLEGYPWWPGLIKKDPDEGIYYKNDKIPVAHVQFFGDHSRAWIKLRNLKKYTSPKHADIPPNNDDNWKLAVKEAEEIRLRSDSPSNDAENVSPKSDGSETANKCTGWSSSQNKRKGHNASNGSVKKRRRIVVESEGEDSEDEYKPEDSESESENESSGVEEVEVSEEEPDLSEDEETPKKSKAKQNLKTSKAKTNGQKNSLINESTKSKLAKFGPSEGSPLIKSAPGEENKVWAHLKLDWLKDGNRKDIKGRPQSHPDYDPHTLFIPESFKKTMTPALKQWWSIKAEHFDTVLFFKVGKFYELYHMDAVIGVNELGLIFMKGEFAHSGFPEISYGRYSDALIQRGYKVARVEQTETPQMMEERCKHLARPTKYDRVVQREVCRISTKGTKTLSFLDDGAAEQGSSYLLSLVEKYIEGITGDESQYGVCFIDTTIGKFHLGQFNDDRHGSRLRTLLAHYPPSQVLYVPGKLSPKTQKMLDGCLASVIKEAVRPSSDYKDASKTLQSLSTGGYFANEDSEEASVTWPEVLKNMLDESDPLNQTAKDEFILSIQALGICVWYLKDCCIEEELLSMRNFEQYSPVDEPTTESKIPKVTFEKFQQHMVLDGVTLQNLEVLENNSGGLEGTLLQTMDCTVTAFGKRLFRQWICSPLCNPASIADRLNAIDDLHSVPDVMSDAVKQMKKLPDLERLLSKIHTQASARRSKNHPDSRAIFYEDVTYSRRKINDFIVALEGFTLALEIIQSFEQVHRKFRSKVLKNCVTLKSEGGHFPSLKEALTFFEHAFDHEKAKKEGKIIPCKGVDNEYDNALSELKETEAELNDYLKEQCKKFGCKVTYVGSGRTRYQLEVPEHATKRVTDEYELQSQRKGFKRYWTEDIKDLLAKMMNAEEHRDAALKDIMRRIFANFDKRFKEWEAAVHCLSVLDALISLSEFSSSFQVTCCRPEFALPEVGSQPFVEICNGYHPCLMKAFGGDFIPNDIYIGCSPEGDGKDGKKHSGSLILVTGPNMGGKSTLMRQTGLIVIMAQMGSYIPATSVRLTPVDRVFTRLGASDRIMAGESTFFVELSETASILQHASRHSFVLMDELGRGTATYDGTAIACAVVQELAHITKCRTLFSTHYHSLVDEFSSHASVQLGHMSCMVENENKDDPTKETITFLYKFVEGACPKSYGFNVAQLAGIPEEAIKKGFQKAKQLEQFVEERKLFRILMTANGANEICSAHKKLLAMNDL